MLLWFGLAVFVRALPLAEAGKYRVLWSMFRGIGRSSVTVHKRLSHTDVSLSLSDSVFVSCDGFRGGAVYCESEHVWIRSCVFDNTSANYGGGVFAAGIRDGHFESSVFTYQHARNLGAGIMLDCKVVEFNPVTISGVNFSYGSATSVGALECWGGVQRIIGCVIDHCRSTFSWPAVRISSTEQKSVITDTQFSNNFSRERGCCIGLHLARTRADILNCVFLNNRQLSTSGTTAYTEQTQCSLTFQNCVIYGDRDRQFGGSKKPWTTWVTLTNTTFIYDRAVDWSKDTPAPTASPYCHECPLFIKHL